MRSLCFGRSGKWAARGINTRVTQLIDHNSAQKHRPSASLATQTPNFPFRSKKEQIFSAKMTNEKVRTTVTTLQLPQNFESFIIRKIERECRSAIGNSADSCWSKVHLVQIKTVWCVWLFVRLTVCPSVCVSLFLSVFLSVSFSVCFCLYLCLCFCQSLCLCFCLHFCLSVCLSAFLSVCLQDEEENLRLRLKMLVLELARSGTVKGFSYFTMYLRGKEELVISVVNEPLVSTQSQGLISRVISDLWSVPSPRA